MTVLVLTFLIYPLMPTIGKGFLIKQTDPGRKGNCNIK
jgi:uncharacterized membrane protein (DUF4010 family)